MIPPLLPLLLVTYACPLAAKRGSTEASRVELTKGGPPQSSTGKALGDTDETEMPESDEVSRQVLIGLVKEAAAARTLLKQGGDREEVELREEAELHGAKGW